MVLVPTHRPLPHPGEVLLEEFLEPLGMSQAELARRLRIPATRVGEIVNARRGITPDTALRLAQLFGTSAEFWLNGQLAWDLFHAMRSDAAKDIKKIRAIKPR